MTIKIEFTNGNSEVRENIKSFEMQVPEQVAYLIPESGEGEGIPFENITNLFVE